MVRPVVDGEVDGIERRDRGGVDASAEVCLMTAAVDDRSWLVEPTDPPEMMDSATRVRRFTPGRIHGRLDAL